MKITKEKKEKLLDLIFPSQTDRDEFCKKIRKGDDMGYFPNDTDEEILDYTVSRFGNPKFVKSIYDMNKDLGIIIQSILKNKSVLFVESK